ncbi:class I SAM-dependent methyltransferase [Legionella lytica]|uniref:Class I SAM-dependent methyltransferase n=1 Tax=Legionella lytica TaxID=96232 RepID=A0ABW8DAY7_9GAMM
MTNAQYNNKYSEQNVYGHVVSLIKEHGVSNGVHLDIGAGFGAIAEPLKAFGLTYIGVDNYLDGAHSLQDRGFPFHKVDLLDTDNLYKNLLDILGNQKLASISIIDTLEHLINNVRVLTEIHKVAEKFNSILVVSVPNTSHKDISLKLLTGRFDYTYTGLLDHTHVFLYTNDTLNKITKHCGWRQINQYDVKMTKTEQFIEDNILLHEQPIFAQYINNIKEKIDPYHDTYQLVRAYLPAYLHEIDFSELFKEPPVENKVFLSIIIRTQGLRCSTLRDAILCLSAQSNQDFEIVLVGHKLSLPQQIKIEQIISEQSEDMKNKIRFLLINDAKGRAAPLNRAIKVAKGQYVSVLDDDDVVFSNWVENFQILARKDYGRVLRATCVEQDIQEVVKPSKNEDLEFKTIGKIKNIYPSQFNLLDHLENNYSPFMSWSFPRSIFHDFHFEFDESLAVCEDWDLAMRAGLFCGVSSNSTITAIYRKWKIGNNSFNTHPPEQWQSDRLKIIAKFYKYPQIIPADSIKEIIKIKSQNGALQAELEEIKIKLENKQREYDEKNLNNVRNPVSRALFYLYNKILTVCRKLKRFFWNKNNYSVIKG